MNGMWRKLNFHFEIWLATIRILLRARRQRSTQIDNAHAHVSNDDGDIAKRVSYRMEYENHFIWWTEHFTRFSRIRSSNNNNYCAVRLWWHQVKRYRNRILRAVKISPKWIMHPHLFSASVCPFPPLLPLPLAARKRTLCVDFNPIPCNGESHLNRNRFSWGKMLLSLSQMNHSFHHHHFVHAANEHWMPSSLCDAVKRRLDAKGSEQLLVF